MTEVRLRARSVSEIVDAAFALYRQDSGQYILAMAIATIPQLILRTLLRTDGTPSMGTLMLSLILTIVSGLTFSIGSAAIMKSGSSAYLGDPEPLEASLRNVIPKVGTIIWAGLLKSVLFGIGFLCFIVGAFYVAARFFAVTSTIVLEDVDAGEAFSRSSQLSSGRKRHILNTLILVWIIYILLSACVTVAAGITRSFVMEIILTSAFQIVAYPVVGLAGMVLYYDCRIRGEGFDIEQMAASMDRGPGSPPGMAGATT